MGSNPTSSARLRLQHSKYFDLKMQQTNHRMDAFGKNPTSETGEYFRANIWWWGNLASYCCTATPEITKHCTHWGSNDGDGLNSG